MEREIMETIYEQIKDICFDSYDEEDLDVGVFLYENILQDLVIDVCLKNEIYTINCTKTFIDREGNKDVER